MWDDWEVEVNPKLQLTTMAQWGYQLELDNTKKYKKSKKKKKKGGGMGHAKQLSKWSKCSDTHKPVTINCNDGTYYVYGGSCTSPGGVNNLKDVDVFVGLDSGMKKTDRRYPWTDGVEFLFRITDMSVPKDVKQFKIILVYLSGMIKDGKKVFIGCIGGHGRTGLVLAALITHMTGDKDSTQYLRNTYCKKAVESGTQIKWLQTHFGIEPVEPSKGGYSPGSYKTGPNTFVQDMQRVDVLKPVETDNSIFPGCNLKY